MAKPKALAGSNWMNTKQFCRKYLLPFRSIKKAFVWGLLRQDRDVSFDLRYVNVPAVMRKEADIVLLEAISRPTRQERLWARPHVHADSEGKRRVAEKILQLRREMEETRQKLISLVLADRLASKEYWNLLWEPPDCPWCHGEQRDKNGKRCVYCREAS